MIKFSEMSDFDINEKIAILKGATEYDGQVRGRVVLEKFCAVHGNPCRAIAERYLMMTEGM